MASKTVVSALRQDHLTVSGCKNFGACWSGKVHAVMHFSDLIDGMNAIAIATRHALQIFVSNGLNGRDGFEQFRLIFGQIKHLIK